MLLLLLLISFSLTTEEKRGEDDESVSFAGAKHFSAMRLRLMSEEKTFFISFAIVYEVSKKVASRVEKTL